MTTDDKIIHQLTLAQRVGMAATAADVGAWLGLSRQSVHEGFNRLERAGRLKVSNRRRSPQPLFLRVVRNTEQTF